MITIIRKLMQRLDKEGMLFDSFYEIKYNNDTKTRGERTVGDRKFQANLICELGHKILNKILVNSSNNVL